MPRKSKTPGNGHRSVAYGRDWTAKPRRSKLDSVAVLSEPTTAIGKLLPVQTNAGDAGHDRSANSPYRDAGASSPNANVVGLLTAADIGPVLNATDIRTLIDDIRAAHRARCFAMEQRKRANNALGSFLRTSLGWRLDMPEKERNRIADDAADIASGEVRSDRFAAIVEAAELSRAPFDAIEADAKKTMANLAEQLPVWRQFEPVRGFGPISLAVIVGEAGDIGAYRSHSALWKRMGVAVMGNLRQGGLPKTAKAEEWIAHGYNRQRRSRLWNIGDALIKGNKDGRYRTTYLARKAYEIARNPEIKPIAAHRRAQRYMEKRLLRDLWQAWRGGSSRACEKPFPSLPLPEISEAA